MRRYITITTHMIAVDNGSDNSELKSPLLNFQRFSGPHSGKRIASMIEETLTDSSTKDKVHHIVTNNAADMHAAFRKQF